MEDRASRYYTQRTLYSFDRYSAFEATSRDFGRYVVMNQIQLYYSDAQETLKDCERVIKRWCMLEHRNLPETIDAWTEEKRLVFVWLVPQGVTLGALIQSQHSFDEGLVFDIAFQIASVMRYLHQNDQYQGVLTPNSFTLARDKWVTLICGNLPQQINRIFEKAESGFDQAQDLKKIKRQDITAWGVIVGSLLTSDPYFVDKLIKNRELETETFSIRKFNPRVTAEFESAIIKSLQTVHNPQKGFADYEQLCADLAQISKDYISFRTHKESM